MKTSSFIYPLTGMAALASLASCGSEKEAPKQYNIVYIMTDDHTAQMMSCYGSRFVETPNLDRIANDGVIFTNSFVANSLSGPSRACMLTGKHSHANGFTDNTTCVFDGSQQTMPKLLQKAGYQTAIIGKWHLISLPTGFDHWEIVPEQGDYYNPDFMMKEIHEQPKAVRDTLNSVLVDGKLDMSAVGLSDEDIKKIDQICIVACGSAYHVGVAAQYVIEDLAQIPVRTELASEFRYRKPLLSKNELVIIVSQSGETADSLAALRLAKEKGIKTLGIVNVVGSSIAREADNVFYTLAGPEIAVATTKAYSTQLIAAYCLAIQFAMVRGTIDEAKYLELIKEMAQLPDKIQKIIEDKERIQWFAAKQVNAKDIFFIGRGLDYAVSLEGSLKMKEISYIHSEAYAAGELKHGTISLIEDGTLVIGVLTQSELYEKTVSNMVECRSRGAYLMGLTTYGNYNIEDTADFTVYIPKTDEHFMTSLAVIPLQLMGYYVSVSKGLDVDKPRNLAKSVTVE